MMKSDAAKIRVALVLGLLLSTVTAPALAAEQAPEQAQEQGQNTPPRGPKEITGPMKAIVTKVVDGDTVRVEVQTWLGQTTETLVRVNGIDTPELRGACASEKEQARAARAKVLSLAPLGSTVQLQNIKSDKYGGRVVADVILADGHSLGDALVKANLARAYTGERRAPWCS